MVQLGNIRVWFITFLHRRNVFLGGCRLAALGVRNVMNHTPALAEVWLTLAFDTIKYLYKYCFSLPCVTRWLSTTTLWRSKTYCFALQKRRFCKVKAAVLQRKTYAFGKQKKKHWFSVKIFQRLWEGEMGELNDRTKKVGARIAHAPTIVPNTYVQFIGCRKCDVSHTCEPIYCFTTFLPFTT